MSDEESYSGLIINIGSNQSNPIQEQSSYLFTFLIVVISKVYEKIRKQINQLYQEYQYDNKEYVCESVEKAKAIMEYIENKIKGKPNIEDKIKRKPKFKIVADVYNYKKVIEQLLHRSNVYEIYYYKIKQELQNYCGIDEIQRKAQLDKPLKIKKNIDRIEGIINKFREEIQYPQAQMCIKPNFAIIGNGLEDKSNLAEHCMNTSICENITKYDFNLSVQKFKKQKPYLYEKFFQNEDFLRLREQLEMTESLGKHIKDMYVHNRQFYTLINNGSRSIKNIQKFFSYITPSFLLLKAIRKFGKFGKSKVIECKEKLLWRGGLMSKQELKRTKNALGAYLHFYGFVSTSKKKQVALEFMKQHSQSQHHLILFKIKCPQRLPFEQQDGNSLLQVFAQNDEAQILFNLGTIYKIIGVQENNIEGRHYHQIQLQYINRTEIINKQQLNEHEKNLKNYCNLNKELNKIKDYGQMLEFAGYPQLAQEYYEKKINTDSNDENAKNNLIKCMHNLGKPLAALEILEDKNNLRQSQVFIDVSQQADDHLFENQKKLNDVERANKHPFNEILKIKDQLKEIENIQRKSFRQYYAKLKGYNQLLSLSQKTNDQEQILWCSQEFIKQGERLIKIMLNEDFDLDMSIQQKICMIFSFLISCCGKSEIQQRKEQIREFLIGNNEELLNMIKLSIKTQYMQTCLLYFKKCRDRNPRQSIPNNQAINQFIKEYIKEEESGELKTLKMQMGIFNLINEKLQKKQLFTKMQEYRQQIQQIQNDSNSVSISKNDTLAYLHSSMLQSIDPNSKFYVSTDKYDHQEFLQKAKETIITYERLQELLTQQGHYNSKQILEVKINIAETYFKTGNLRSSLQKIQQTLKVANNKRMVEICDAKFLKGKIYHILGRAQEAVELFMYVELKYEKDYINPNDDNSEQTIQNQSLYQQTVLQLCKSMLYYNRIKKEEHFDVLTKLNKLTKILEHPKRQNLYLQAQMNEVWGELYLAKKDRRNEAKNSLAKAIKIRQKLQGQTIKNMNAYYQLMPLFTVSELKQENQHLKKMDNISSGNFIQHPIRWKFYKAKGEQQQKKTQTNGTRNSIVLKLTKAIKVSKFQQSHIVICQLRQQIARNQCDSENYENARNQIQKIRSSIQFESNQIVVTEVKLREKNIILKVIEELCQRMQSNQQ